MAREQAVAAFCPGHISGYFRRVIGNDAATTGSIGAGIVISEGVVSRVRPSGHTTIGVFRRDPLGRPIRIAQDSPPVRSALYEIGTAAAVTTECRLPIGSGFGLSAAALLATLTAVNRLYDLGLSEKQIAHAAHGAEIRNRTGLGDVAACRGGGMVVRNVAGVDAPVQRFLHIREPVAVVSFGPIHTPAVLSSKEQMNRIAAAYPRGVPGGIVEFFSRSREFARASGLITPQVAAILDACEERGVPAAMTMLGNGVFACGRQAPAILSRFGTVCDMTIAKEGPRIIAEGA